MAEPNNPPQGEPLPVEEIPNVPFPTPPPFWKHFTTANANRLKELESSEKGLPPRLPLELTFLRPPALPPASAKAYDAFNISIKTANELDSVFLDQELLVFDPDKKPLRHAVLLMQLTKSLMLKFLELTTMLSADPERYQELTEELKKLVYSIQSVINMYRPHQARESVKELLEGMLEDGRREMEEADAAKKRVQDFLQDIEAWRQPRNDSQANASGTIDDKTSNGAVSKEELDEAKRLWKIVHEIAED